MQAGYVAGRTIKALELHCRIDDVDKCLARVERERILVLYAHIQGPGPSSVSRTLLNRHSI